MWNYTTWKHVHFQKAKLQFVNFHVVLIYNFNLYVAIENTLGETNLTSCCTTFLKFGKKIKAQKKPIYNSILEKI